MGAQTYTAVVVLADALRRAGSDDPKKIREALAATNLRTAIGMVSFNNRREVRKAFPISVVKNGQWTALAIVAVAVPLLMMRLRQVHRTRAAA